MHKLTKFQITVNCICNDKMKNEKKCHTVGTFLKFNRKMVERRKIYTPNTQILVHEHSLSSLIYIYFYFNMYLLA